MKALSFRENWNIGDFHDGYEYERDVFRLIGLLKKKKKKKVDRLILAYGLFVQVFLFQPIRWRQDPALTCLFRSMHISLTHVISSDAGGWGGNWKNLILMTLVWKSNQSFHWLTHTHTHTHTPTWYCCSRYYHPLAYCQVQFLHDRVSSSPRITFN